MTRAEPRPVGAAPRFELPAICPEFAPLRDRGLAWADPRAFRFPVPAAARELILVRDGFASAEECRALIEIYAAHHAPGPDQASNVLRSPVVWSSALLGGSHRAAWRQIQRIKARIITAARAAFQLDELFVEADVLNRMVPGEVHIEHADNADYRCAQHGDHRWIDGDCTVGRWVPMSHRWWRDISAVLYLDDAFEGGSLRFDQHGVTVQPRPGLLVAFPSSRMFLHHVTRVTSGVRHALAMWCTRDWEHANP